MSAPPEKTLKDLTGKWTMDRTLSGDPAQVLALQGFNTIIQKTASHTPVHLSISQSSKEQEGTTYIEIEQKTVGSIPAINEEWTLDWEWREQNDKFLGKVRSRSRWRNREEIEGSWFLKEGFEEDEIVEAEVESLEGGWRARQVWGFGDEGGKRLLVRRVVTSKDEESIETKLVYTFDG